MPGDIETITSEMARLSQAVADLQRDITALTTALLFKIEPQHTVTVESWRLDAVSNGYDAYRYLRPEISLFTYNEVNLAATFWSTYIPSPFFSTLQMRFLSTDARRTSWDRLMDDNLG